MAVPCYCNPQKCIIIFEKLFLLWVPMNIQKDWKAKLERGYSVMLKYSKITVWSSSDRSLIPPQQIRDHPPLGKQITFVRLLVIVRIYVGSWFLKVSLFQKTFFSSSDTPNNLRIYLQNLPPSLKSGQKLDIKAPSFYSSKSH